MPGSGKGQSIRAQDITAASRHGGEVVEPMYAKRQRRHGIYVILINMGLHGRKGGDRRRDDGFLHGGGGVGPQSVSTLWPWPHYTNGS